MPRTAEQDADDAIADSGKSPFDARASTSTVVISLRPFKIPPYYIYMLQTQPELAATAVSDPRRFAELLRELSSRRADQDRHRTLEIERLNADPFDVDAQQRIEEAIRQEAVLENLEHAINIFQKALSDHALVCTSFTHIGLRSPVAASQLK